MTPARKDPLRLNPARAGLPGVVARMSTSAGVPDHWVGAVAQASFVSKSGRTAAALAREAFDAGTLWAADAPEAG